MDALVVMQFLLSGTGRCTIRWGMEGTGFDSFVYAFGNALPSTMIRDGNGPDHEVGSVLLARRLGEMKGPQHSAA